MIDTLFYALMIGITLAALIKRSEMALWLFLITALGSIVTISNSSPESSLIFFCGANLLFMRAAFSNWSATKLNLPLFIGILSCANVVTGFIHYLHLLNIGTVSYTAGIIAGAISYTQLMLVCFMKDSRGVMNDILNDSRDLFHGILHLDSNNKNNGRNK
jgi:general stress protein CsbA